MAAAQPVQVVGSEPSAPWPSSTCTVEARLRPDEKSVRPAICTSAATALVVLTVPVTLVGAAMVQSVMV